MNTFSGILRSLGAGRAACLCLVFLAAAMAGCPSSEENRYVLAVVMTCDDHGVILETRRYDYDDRWRRTGETVTDGKDAVRSTTSWRYLTDDHAIKTERRPDQPGWSRQSEVWYTQGRVREEAAVVRDDGAATTIRVEYTYNAHGDPASYTRTVTDDRGRLLERFSELYEYKYTEWGKPAVKTVKMGESPSSAASSRTTYRYNVDFMLISEETASEEGLTGQKQYVYDDHQCVIAMHGDHPSRHEYYKYFDKVQGKPEPPRPPAFPLAGTVNDADVLIVRSNEPGAEKAGTLLKEERVSVLEVSDRIDAREGLRAPWFRIRTAEGLEGWTFGYFIDTDGFFNVLAFGGDILDSDPPPVVLTYVYFNRPRTRLYNDLVGFTVGETAPAGDQARFLRQDNHLYLSNGCYHRFFLVSYHDREWWVSGRDITIHYLPYREGYFTADENPVFREIQGRFTLCLERTLYYTAENGLRYAQLPLTVFRGDESIRFTLSGMDVSDANGDGLEDILLRGEEARSRVTAPGGEKIETERWTRLRNNTLEIMFDHKEKGARGLTLFRYRYEYARDETGFITGITETKTYAGGSSPPETTQYSWNGFIYEKVE